jgi:hypothetical protein
MNASRILALLASLFLLAPTARAHHSAAAYDLAHVATQKGTLTELRFENPHVHFILEVKGSDGTLTTWNIEAAPPHWFRRAGIARSDLAKGVGAPVAIEMHPAKDGGPTGFFQQITFADGTFVRFSDVVQE